MAATARCCPPRNGWRPVLPGGCFPGPWVLIPPPQQQQQQQPQQQQEQQEQQQEFEAASSSISSLDKGEKSHKHRGASFAVAAVKDLEQQEKTGRRRRRPPSRPPLSFAKATVVVVAEMEMEEEREGRKEKHAKADQRQPQEHSVPSAPPPPPPPSSSLPFLPSTQYLSVASDLSPPLAALAAEGAAAAVVAAASGEARGDDAKKGVEEDSSSSSNSILLEGRFLRLYQEELERLEKEENQLQVQRERGQQQQQQQQQLEGEGVVVVEEEEEGWKDEDVTFSLEEAVRWAQQQQEQQQQEEQQQQRELEEMILTSPNDDEAPLPVPVVAMASTPPPPPPPSSSPTAATAGHIYNDRWGKEEVEEEGVVESTPQVLGSTRVEVLGTERKKNKKGEGNGGGEEGEEEEDAIFLVRFTRVEAEEVGWVEEWRWGEGGGGGGSTTTMTTAARLVRHRVRVVRKTRAGLEELHAQLHEMLQRMTTTTAATAAAAAAANELVPVPVLALPSLPDLGLPLRGREERIRQGNEGGKASSLRFGELFASSSRQQQQERRQREALLEEYSRALKEMVEGLSTTTAPAAGAAAAAAAISRILRVAFQQEAGREDLLIRLRTEPVPDMTSARREELWARQGGKCRGCGQRLLIGLLEKKNFMTCRYLQALFCTEFCADSRGGSSSSSSSSSWSSRNSSSNNSSSSSFTSSKNEDGMCVLPGPVLTKWDFRQRRVALPALVFLQSIRRLPVFSLASLLSMTTFPSSSSSSSSNNSAVQRQIKYVQNLRRQLQHLSAGLLVLSSSSSSPSSSSLQQPTIACACPVARRLLAPVLQSRPHFLLRAANAEKEEEVEENESVSLVDLQELQTGVLSDVLSGLLEALHAHVVEGEGGRECQFCKGRGRELSYDPFAGSRRR